MKALSFGSLNIDYTYRVDHFVQRGETLSTESLQVFTGGKGLNQSIALGKAGAKVFHAGAIGQDGIFLLDAMKQAGVDTGYVDIMENVRTGNAIIQNDRNGDNCILLYGGANQEITIGQVDSVIQNFESGDFLILQNEINNLSYIMESAHQKGMKIVLNPSPMNEKIKKLPLEYADIFMLNEVEAGQILESECEENREVLIEKLQKRFPKALIVLTLGGEGAVCLDQNRIYSQKAYKVEAVDTTAAGDTFTGFFIGSLMNGRPLKDAMDLAARASAVAVTRQGAAPSIPTLDEVKAYKFED